MRVRTASGIVVASLAMAACFTVGTPFEVPNVDESQLGRMTLDRLLAGAGSGAPAPNMVTKRGVRMQCYEFDSYKAGIAAAGRGLLGRSAEYCFAGGVLVAYLVTSNVKGESTDFDAAKARTIGRGMTRAEVIALLGRPAGVAIDPIAQVPDGRQLRYSYTGYNGTVTLKKDVLKDATIELDGNGVVVASNVGEALQ